MNTQDLAEKLREIWVEAICNRRVAGNPFKGVADFVTANFVEKEIVKMDYIHKDKLNDCYILKEDVDRDYVSKKVHCKGVGRCDNYDCELFDKPQMYLDFCDAMLDEFIDAVYWLGFENGFDFGYQDIQIQKGVMK